MKVGFHQWLSSGWNHSNERRQVGPSRIGPDSVHGSPTKKARTCIVWIQPILFCMCKGTYIYRNIHAYTQTRIKHPLQVGIYVYPSYIIPGHVSQSFSQSFWSTGRLDSVSQTVGFLSVVPRTLSFRTKARYRKLFRSSVPRSCQQPGGGECGMRKHGSFLAGELIFKGHEKKHLYGYDKKWCI